MGGRYDFLRLVVGLVAVLIIGLVYTISHCLIAGWCSPSRILQMSRGIHHDREESTTCLEHSKVELLIVKTYTKEGRTVGTDEDEAMCSVCLGEFKEGEELRILQQCEHSFHVECIGMWLYSHTTCPLCRVDATLPQQYVLSQQNHETSCVRELPIFPGNSSDQLV